MVPTLSLSPAREGGMLSVVPTGVGPREGRKRRVSRHLPAGAGVEGMDTKAAAGQDAMRVGGGDLMCLPRSSASSQLSSLGKSKGWSGAELLL